MQYKLQNILFPDRKICNEPEMYVHTDDKAVVLKDKIIMQAGSVCDFSTYFNSFSLNKWKMYTHINNLSLSLAVKGRFILRVFTAALFKEDIIRDCLYEKLIDCETVDHIRIPIDMEQGDSIFFEITALQGGGELYGGYYATETEESELHPVEIDLVMCTFKREKYLLRNLDLITAHFMEDPMYNAGSHFHVRIVDNDGGSVLPKYIKNDEKVKLYPNLNVGGSGGFARGMMEALKENTCTHILFMDDDVLVQVEAFERTYNFLRFIKEEHENDFLCGGMLRLDHKNIQHENLAAFKGNHLVGIKQGIDLNKFEDVLFNEKVEYLHGIYGAWWFCCIPKTIANLSNLPYPFFIRMDDIEYSIRNIKNVISLNGISVWHEAFDKKYSPLMENYFMFRNNLVVNLLHDTGNLKSDLKFFFRRFAREIFRYDYGGAELLLDGVENFLKGPEFYKNIDTVSDLKSHAVKQEKVLLMKDVKGVDLIESEFKSAIDQDKERKVIKLLRFITWNGHLLPGCLFKDFGFAEYGYTANSKMYFLRKRVLACNLNFDNAADLRISRRRFIKLLIRYTKLNVRLIKQYSVLKKWYRSEFAEMTSENFWHQYLKLH